MAKVQHPLFASPLPDGWRLIVLDEVRSSEPSSCVAGPFGSNISSKYFVDEGVPVIRGSNLRDDLTQFVSHGFVFVSPERALSYRAQHVRAGDLVFTCWGTVGQVGLIPANGPYPEYIISNKQLKLRPNTDLADPKYLFYYFASPPMVQYVKGRAIGAAVPGINLGILKALPVVIPPMKEQRRIVAVLSAYDDLIETNARRIKILEEMARSLYREWFVEFRFPGHEKVKLVDSPMGELPQGWRFLPIGDVVGFHIGGGWGEEQVGESHPESAYVIRGTDIPSVKVLKRDAVPLRYHSVSNLMSRRLAAGDLVFEVSGGGKVVGVGRTCLVSDRLLSGFDAPVICASFCKRIVPDRAKLDPVLLFLHVSRRFEAGDLLQYEVQSTGIRNLKFGVFLEREHVIVPPMDWQARFVGVVDPLLAQAEALAEKNAKLRTTRDLLLPRLLSGEIDVSSLPDPT